MSEALRLADALEDTPNWQKESFGSDWKSSTRKFDRTPFEAAVELRLLHSTNEQLRAQNTELDAACAKLEALNAELVEALRKIALTDYRGNQPQEIAIARAALAKVGVSNG